MSHVGRVRSAFQRDYPATIERLVNFTLPVAAGAGDDDEPAGSEALKTARSRVVAYCTRGLASEARPRLAQRVHRFRCYPDD